MESRDMDNVKMPVTNFTHCDICKDNKGGLCDGCFKNLSEIDGLNTEIRGQKQSIETLEESLEAMGEAELRARENYATTLKAYNDLNETFDKYKSGSVEEHQLFMESFNARGEDLDKAIELNKELRACHAESKKNSFEEHRKLLEDFNARGKDLEKHKQEVRDYEIERQSQMLTIEKHRESKALSRSQIDGLEEKLGYCHIENQRVLEKNKMLSSRIGLGGGSPDVPLKLIEIINKLIAARGALRANPRELDIIEKDPTGEEPEPDTFGVILDEPISKIMFYRHELEVFLRWYGRANETEPVLARWDHDAAKKISQLLGVNS